ncbi:eukaryotic translation elongation factor 1 epsilon-1 [Schistocerca cancellata]|uniref:eukaryotic translation elongation factor 1 epsilon-1 n=1 Tax=Schistocerca cancellata TaxID=274614 RepID=UPI002119191B|nr:eukaryotic translation elongation factor 1 epsilon-1 [Schistocerca cancellata]
MVLCDVNRLRQLCRSLGVETPNLKSDAGGNLTISASDLSNGRLPNELVTGFGTIALSLAKKADNSLLGKTAEEEACVRQWVEYAVCYINLMDSPGVQQRVLKELNSFLADKTFFVSYHQTLVDKMYYHLLYDVMSSLTFQEKEQYVHLSRWYNHLQQDTKLRQNNKLIMFSRRLLYV